MKDISLFFVLIFCGFGVFGYAQPVRIDLSGAEFIEEQSQSDSVNHTLTYLSEGSFVYPSIDLRVSYFIPSVGLEPVVHTYYQPGRFMLDAGIQKPFKIVHATLTPGLGIGYSHQKYYILLIGAPDISFTNNDVFYWIGASLYAPLLEFADLAVGYRMMFKKNPIMEQQPSDGNVKFVLEAHNPKHLLTAGISFVLGKGKEKPKHK